jgi:multiple sugar transport system substrate-binding protein
MEHVPQRRFAQKDAAYESIRFMTAPEQQRFRAVEGSFLPALRSLYKDREILSEAPVIRLSQDVIPNARTRPVTPCYSAISARLAGTFNANLRGDVSPEEAVQSL